MDSIDESLATCKSIVVESLRMEYEEAVIQIKRCLTDSSDFSDRDADQFYEKMVRSKNFAQVADSLGLQTDSNYVGPSSFADSLNLQAELLKESLINLKNIFSCQTSLYEMPNGIEVYSRRLDKLRRLSLKFLVANTSMCYQAVREDLSAKIRKSVDSVKWALQQNKFGQAATGLDEMQNVLSHRLQEHFTEQESSISEVTYNDCVRAVEEHITAVPNESRSMVTIAVQGSSLGRVELKEIQSCLEILKSASEYPGLAKHLQQGFVSNVHTAFAHELINLFQVMIDKGTNLMEDQKENSFKMENCFSILGTLVKEMTAIRKLPDIETKTAEMFFDFFGKVVQCLLQMKAEVEDVMRRVSTSTTSDDAMIRHQENRPDISKLPGLIAGMKKAQWMDEYREGVYTHAVKDIETVILQYARVLSSSTHPFGIDSCEDVRRMAQTLDEFEYLERMEETIPGLDKMHHDAKKVVIVSMENAKELVMGLFPRIVSNVTNSAPAKPSSLADRPAVRVPEQTARSPGDDDNSEGELCLTATFPSDGETCQGAIEHFPGEEQKDNSAKTEEQSSSQKISSDMTYLDAEAAEDALKFILACKDVKQSIIHNGVIQIHGLFRNGVNRYIQMVDAEIKKQFGALTTGNQGDIDKTGLFLHDALQEATHLKEQHPNLFKLYKGPDFVSAFLKQLKNTWYDLSLSLNDVGREGDVGKMDNQLRIVRALWRLDEFLENDECKFMNLYREYSSKLVGLQDKGMEELTALVQNKQFGRFIEDLEYYGLSDDSKSLAISKKLARLKGELSSSLYDFIYSQEKKALHLARDLPVKDVTELMEGWRTLLGAKLAVDRADDNAKKEYLRFTAQDDKASNDSFKKIMESKMLGVHSQIEQALKGQQFMKADSLMARLIRVKSLIGTICSDKIAAKIDQLEAEQESRIEEHINKYKNMNLEDYPFDPPREFFARFETGTEMRKNAPPDADRDDTHDYLKAKYTNQLAQLHQTMNHKIREQICARDLRSGSEDLNHIEAAIRSLPEGHHKDNLEDFLKQKKDLYEKSISEQLKTFQSALERLDKPIALSVLNSACSEQIIRPLLERNVKNALQKVKSVTFDILEKHPCASGLGLDAVKMCDFFFEAQQALSPAAQSEIMGTFENIKRCLEGAESAACTSLRAHFGAVTMDTMDPRFQNVQATYTFVNSLLAFKRIISDMPVSQHVLPKDLGNSIRQIQSEIVNDYESKRMMLVQLFNPEPHDQDFDFKQAAVILEVIKSRDAIYSSARREIQDGNAGLAPPSVQEFLHAFIAKNYPRSDEFWVINEHHRFLDESDKVFYELLGKQTGSCENLKPIIPYCDDDLAGIGKSFAERVKGRALKCFTEMSSMIDQLANPARTVSINKACEKINAFYCHLELFKKHVCPRLMTASIQLNLETCVDKLHDCVENLGCKVDEGAGVELSKIDLDGIALCLVKMKQMADGLVFMKQDCMKKMVSHLDNFQRGANGKRAIAKLAVKLRDAKYGPEGVQLVNELDVFKGYLTYIFNSKTQAQDINYVLKHKDLLASVENDLKAIHQLQSSHLEFENEYKRLVLAAISQQDPLSIVANSIRTLLHGVIISREQDGNCKWSPTMTNSIPQLVANIFAMWTLNHSKCFLDALDPREKESFLHKPHPSQVIAIFRMFGIGRKTVFPCKESLVPRRNLVQVKTGEGKTAILAVACCVFALFGYEVNVACYSEYLSHRDFEGVRFLFEKLQIDKQISYCTLTQLCNYEINKKLNIRERLEEMIAGVVPITKVSDAKSSFAGAAWSLLQGVGEVLGYPKTVKRRPRVLLVDEVDVFFSEDFYGNMYTAICDLQHESISEIVTNIWRAPNPHSISINAVRQWPAYANFSQKFKGWEFLMDSAISQMIQDLRTFESHEYCCVEGKIGYTEHDSVAFNVSYGYKTIFAYLREYDNGKVSKETLERNLPLLVTSGSFLFAKIPCDFDVVMGVTGTLQCLSESEKTIVETTYEIKEFTYMPSVYGEYKLDYFPDRDTHVLETDFFASKLDEEIEKSFKDRAVLVFFESAERLRAFQASSAYKESHSTYKDWVYLLTEETPTIVKEDIIKCRATALNSVTLLTKPFGRGTDFVCADDTVNKNGGVHVIQTFLSESQSEEIQIKGRTSRQGENGSFRMILDVRDLEKFQVTDTDIQACKASGKYYEMLHEKRQAFFAQKYAHITNFVEENEKKHKAALQFVTDLHNRETENVKAFLMIHNPILKSVQGKTRILVLMDGTGSMDHLFRQAKNTVGTMFDRAQEILQEYGGETLADVFEMQIAIFRNYNSTARLLLQSSAWDCNPRHLRTFLDGIDTDGGWGNEAIEVALQHANCQDNLSHVILIGDAAANTDEEVLTKRAKQTEDYWVSKGFRKTTYREQVQYLADNGIPVMAFYVSGQHQTKLCFDEISRTTRGQSSYLNINSDSGAADLINCITEVILSSVGGANKGGVLVEEYKKRYCNKAYRA